MVTHSVLHQTTIPYVIKEDVWKKLDYRRVKFPTIDFTRFRPKPLVTQVGVLNFQRCKNFRYLSKKKLNLKYNCY